MKYLIYIILLISILHSKQVSLDLSKDEKQWLENNPNIKIAVMNYWEHDGYGNTIHSDYLKLLSKYGNLNILTTIHDSWDDAYNQVIDKNSPIHAIMNLSWSKERQRKYFLYTNSYNIEPNYLIVRNETNTVNNLQDLRNKTVILKEKSITNYIIKEISDDIKIITTKSDSQMYKKLFENKSIDAIMTYKKDSKLLKKYNLKIVRSLYDKFSEVSIGVNKNYPLLHSIINKAHQKIPKNELFNLRQKLYNYSFEVDSKDNKHTVINFTDEEKKYLEEKKEIKICLDPNWMPFEKLDEAGKHIGISSDYFSIFQKQINIPIIPVKTDSWTQSLAFIKNRKCDILTLGNETLERKKYLNFTQPYLKIPFVMVTKNDVAYFENFQHLKKEKIGIVKKSSLKELLSTKYPHFNLVEVESNKDGLKRVQNNELFGFIGNMLSVGYILKQNFIQELKIINKLDNKTSNLAVGVRNDDDTLYDIFQKLITNINDGTKTKILNKYMHIKYEKNIDFKYTEEVLFVVIVLILVFLFIQFRLNQLNKELKTKVKEKTQQLKRLNQDLENKVHAQNIELKEKNDQLIEAQHISKLGSWSFDLINNTLKWSDEIFCIFEIDKNKFDASYEMFLNSIHPDDVTLVDSAYKNSLKNKAPYQIKHRLLMNNGRIKWVEERCKTKFDKNGKPVLSIGTIQDITTEYEYNETLKKKDLLLMEQQKLASMGEMIGNIAHQWRQPLSVISTLSTSYIIKKEFNQDIDLESLYKDMNTINDNTQYLSKTIDDFRNFIRGNSNKKEFNLLKCTEQFLHLVECTVNSNQIKIIKDIDANIHIHGYQNELIQCFINIFNNTKDAHQNTNEEERYFFISQYIEEDKAIIKLKDNAGGIDNEIIKRVFEPYFTTKHQSQGTGIGLSMTYNLIEVAMKGNIQVSNINFIYNDKDYRGTEFTITLPLQH